MKDYFKKARRQHFALGAFNVFSVEMVKAVVEAAKRLRAPVIVESSEGETEFLRPENLVALVENFREEARVPIFTNLDHCRSVKGAKKGMEAGYDMVHFDGSALVFKENIRKTRQVVRWAHRRRVLVEAEIDRIVGSSEWHKDKTALEAQSEGRYTDPGRAEEFVRLTGVDVLASFVGNVHGVYKTAPKLDIERLWEIGRRARCFLSLHGGSGIEAGEIRKAIKAGVVKINVSTELRLAYREALEKALAESQEVALYKIMPPVIKAVQQVVEKKIKMFGAVGKA